MVTPKQYYRIAMIIQKLKALAAKGRWITVKGTPVYIKDGTEIGEAIKKQFDKDEINDKSLERGEVSDGNPDKDKKPDKDSSADDFKSALEKQKSYNLVASKSKEEYDSTLKDLKKKDNGYDFMTSVGNFKNTEAKSPDWLGRGRQSDNDAISVMSSNLCIIHEKSLPQYEKALKIMSESKKYQAGQARIDKEINESLAEHIKTDKNVHRGLHVDEFADIAKDQGIVGKHIRDPYAKKMDFLSTSISTLTAKKYATHHGSDGIIIGFDLTDSDEKSYKATEYKLRNDVYVGGDDPKKMAYRPHEEFNGTQSYLYAGDSEIKLKADTKHKVTSVTIPANASKETISKTEKTVKILEEAQNSKIVINRGQTSKNAMASNKDEKATIDEKIREDGIQSMMKSMGWTREMVEAQMYAWSR